MDKNNLLDELIKKGEALTDTIVFVPSPNGVIRLFDVYRAKESSLYQNWQSSSQRFIKTYFPSDLDDFKAYMKAISPSNHKGMLGILQAIKLIPEEPKTSDMKSISRKNSTDTKIIINNTQQVVLNLFIEAIRDEITGKEYKELKEILKAYKHEPEQTTSKLKEQLKKLGGDVLTNIIANILTNPNIYGGLI